MSPMGVTPSKTCGNGSTPASRRAASLRRRAANSSGSFSPFSALSSGPLIARPGYPLAGLEPDLDLRDLELALGAAGHGDLDDLVALVPDERLPDRRLVRQAVLGRLGLGRADDRVLDRLPGLLVLDVDHRADADLVGAQLLGVDHRGRAKLVLQLRDLGLEHRLLVLGVVVLRVLRDVPELARLLDALGHLAALLRLKELELALELVEAFGGEDDVLRHGFLPSPAQPYREKNPPGAGSRMRTAW